jgi:hypothetical protein
MAVIALNGPQWKSPISLGYRSRHSADVSQLAPAEAWLSTPSATFTMFTTFTFSGNDQLCL